MGALDAVLTDTPWWAFLPFAFVVLGAEALPRPHPLTHVFLTPAVFIAFASLTTVSAHASEPIVPFNPRFSHWDHHWYVWLPRDPVYEAVEVMSATAPKSPLVWAFLTERAAPKRQHHYINDRALAAATGWIYAEIGYDASGSADGPLGLSVRFTDTDGKPVAIAIGFPPGASLSRSGAGLTDQIGHSGDRVFLIFYREQGARTEQSRVTIGGIEMSQPPADAPPLPFRAAYSRNIFVAAIPFGASRVAFGAGRGADLDFMEQTSAEAGHRLYVATRAQGERIELVADSEGRLEQFLDRRGPHVFAVDFSPALADSGESAYRVTLDDFHGLVSGAVRATRQDGDLILDWQHQQPAWTRGYPLRTQLKRGADGEIAMTVSKAAP